MRIRRLALEILLALAIGSGPLASQGQTNEPFYFVQITDTHIGNDWHHRRLAGIVEAINQLPMPIACVVHTGDFAADNIDRPETIAEGLRILKNLKPPLHIVPGNHDILKARLAKTLSAYRKHVGELCTSVTYHGVHFLLVYTEPLRGEIEIPGFSPLEWTKAQLTAAGNNPVIVCHHRPSIEDFYKNRMHAGWPEPQRSAWSSLLQSAEVKAVLAGHFHRDEMHWIGDIPLYLCQPVAGYWGRQASFRLYHYDNGKISYRTRYLDD